MEPDEKSHPVRGMYDGYDDDDAPPGTVPSSHPPPYGGHYPPRQFAAPPPAPTNNVFQISNNVGGGYGLAPGMCTVCRNGKMEDSATGCTWFMCCLCCFLGLIPGCIVFCCCFRKPKCTNCGYTVG